METDSTAIVDTLTQAYTLKFGLGMRRLNQPTLLLLLCIQVI